MFKTILANFHLEKILWILKKRALYIFLFTMICAVGAGYFAVRNASSVYMAQISFYVYSNPDYITDSSVNLGSSDISLAKNLISSYTQIIKSRTFLEKVQEETGITYSVESMRKQISASAISNTAAFSVNVLDPNPIVAMNIANAIGDLAPAEIVRIVKSGGIEILDDAVLPTEPYETTSVKKFILFGAIGGFAVSAGLFLFFGLMDTTVRRKYEIEDLFTIPILGDVPVMLPAKNKEKPKVLLDKDSPFAVKESYSSIRAKLMFTGSGEKCPVYAFTSADPHEGKSLTSINMALSYAQLNKKVLLIDADMRRSGMQDTLEAVEVTSGLSCYLANISDTIDVIAYNDNMDIMLCGEFPPNPAELLAGERFSRLLEECKNKYDVIFIDLPPLGIVSDALVLEKEVTAYILVVREGVTKFDRAEMVVQQLEAIDAHICGFVFNGISLKSQDYNYKKYGKEYKY